MIFLFEAVPEQTVRRYFLQVPARLNLRFPGSRMPVGSTDQLTAGLTDLLLIGMGSGFFRRILERPYSSKKRYCAFAQ
jgi:hypothetical protein